MNINKQIERDKKDIKKLERKIFWKNFFFSEKYFFVKMIFFLFFSFFFSFFWLSNTRADFEISPQDNKLFCTKLENVPPETSYIRLKGYTNDVADNGYDNSYFCGLQFYINTEDGVKGISEYSVNALSGYSGKNYTDFVNGSCYYNGSSSIGDNIEFQKSGWAKNFRDLEFSEFFVCLNQTNQDSGRRRSLEVLTDNMEIIISDDTSWSDDDWVPFDVDWFEWDGVSPLSSAPAKTEYPVCIANDEEGKIECEDYSDGIEYSIDNMNTWQILNSDTDFSTYNGEVYIRWLDGSSDGLALVFTYNDNWFSAGKTWSEIREYISSRSLVSKFIYFKLLNFNYQKEKPVNVASGWWNSQIGFFSSGLEGMVRDITDFLGSPNEFWEWHLSNGGGSIPYSCMEYISFLGVSDNAYLDFFELSSFSSTYLSSALSGGNREKFIIGFFSNEDSQIHNFVDVTEYNENEITNIDNFFAPRKENGEMYKMGEDGILGMYIFSPQCASSVYEDIYEDEERENKYFSEVYFQMNIAYKENDEFITLDNNSENMNLSLTSSDLFNCSAIGNNLMGDASLSSTWKGDASPLELLQSFFGSGLSGVCSVVEVVVKTSEDVFVASTQKVLDTLGVNDFIYSLFPSTDTEICLKPGSEQVPFCNVYRWKDEWKKETPFTRMFLVGLFFLYLIWRIKKFFNYSK